MADVSLLDAARSLQQNTVSEMVKKVGLAWPPAPFVSIRNLICLASDVGPLPPSAVETSQEWMNWGIVDGPNAGYLFAPFYFTPQGPHEIASAIRQAEAAGKTIRALGSGMGFSDVALAESSAVGVKYPDADPKYFKTQAQEARAAALTAGPIEGPADEAYAKRMDAMVPIAQAADKILELGFGYGIDTNKINHSLQPLLPEIVRPDADTNRLFFVEAGIRLSDLDTLLDEQSPPLALRTMGGSHNQSLAGAISTGTHGGDFDRPPLADSVRAFYLIGAEGTHHWIEPTKPITDPAKILGTFPCIRGDHIHYDDDMFRSVLVSMGSMGVIYAVVLDVVQQYSLLNWHKQSTWEQLRRENGPGLSGLFDGSWTGMNEFVWPKFGALPNRFVEVVVCPIRNDDGTHICYATNRVELPSTVPPSGVKPGGYSSISQDDITNAIKSSSDFGLWQGVAFAFANMPGFTQTEKAKSLISFCQSYNYFWAIRAVIKLVLDRTYPIDEPQGPQIDKGYIVMTGSGAFGSDFPIFGVTSIEPAMVLQDAVTFIDDLLKMFDSDVAENKFPAGYISLRVPGQTKALLGMQQFDRTGAVEVAMLCTDAARDMIQQVERMALAKKSTTGVPQLTGSALLHWGQTNGLMTADDVNIRFSGALGFPGPLQKWRAAQAKLGGSTFVNSFMKRCGLVEPRS